MDKQCDEKYVEYMHEYLDGDITTEHEKELREHLQTCSACKQQFEELEKTIALVQSTSHIQAPPGFTEKVLMNLPREKKNVSIKRWFGRHPFLTAAIIFFTLMTGSMLSTWETDEQFTVTKHPDIIIENNTAIVPENVTITGDIVVKNGDILIAGKVEGNVTVINGKVIEDDKVDGGNYLASAGEVTGDIEEIDQVFEWLWFQIKDAMQKVLEE